MSIHHAYTHVDTHTRLYIKPILMSMHKSTHMSLHMSTGTHAGAHVCTHAFDSLAAKYDEGPEAANSGGCPILAPSILVFRLPDPSP